jgi:spore maturation protein CgeB
MKQFFRKIIFSNAQLFAVYKKLRASETTLRRTYLTCKYQLMSFCQRNKYTSEKAFNLAQQAIRARGIKTSEKRSGKLRIFLFGGNEAQDKTGFYQALNNLGELIVFKNQKGEYGPEHDAEPFKRIYIERNDAAFLKQLEAAHKEAPIDILIGQMWAHRMSASVLCKAQSLGIITLNIAMDDRLPWHWGYESGIRLGAIGLKDGIDLTLTTSPECCAWYWCENAPAVYFPLGSDPALFRPSKKSIDVCFVGSKYGIREQIVNTLIASGIHVEAFGPGWPNGPIDSDQVAEVFNKSRIILGIGTVGYNNDLFTLKLRDFDAPMAGALYITHRTPELQQLFKEDEEIAFYEDERQAAEKIKKFLASPTLLEQMGSKARVKACQLYSWEKRLAAAFAYIGITISEAPVQAERQ